MVEKTFKFDDFVKRLLNPKIVRACTVVLSDWEQIPTKSLKAAVTILHRIAYGCSCPAMLYQAKLFRIFQQVFNAAHDVHQEELRRLGIYVVRKFIEIAPTNPKIYAELLFYKSVKEANELESGYCDAYESGTKGTWSEEQEAELRFLFEENQRNPETDKDVIDWILENLIDQTRTRRGILKKLKELDLKFKAPTKKSTASIAAGKNSWRPEEDEELRSLYDQYRTEEDCLQRMIDEFMDRRNKQQIIKRMLQLYMIADKSEILPQKPRRRKNKKNDASNVGEDDFMEEPHFGDDDDDNMVAARPKKVAKATSKKAAKPQKRKIVRTPLDVGTIRALLEQVDGEKYQQAIDWLHECLDDAAHDSEEPSEEDDGVPLLPLQEVQKQAMEDANFQKLLVALGIQPPIVGMESYWRLPTYLNSADLILRAKIVIGEEVQVDVDGIDESDDDNVENEEEADGAGSGEESEEDFFDDYLQRQRRELEGVDKYMDSHRKKINSIMFSKSDEEDKERAPLKEKKKRTHKQKKPKNTDESEEEEDDDIVDQIKKKKDKKKRAPDVDSEEEEKKSDKISIPMNDKDKKKIEKSAKIAEEVAATSKPNTEDLFDQLKAKRASKVKLMDIVAEVTNSEEADEFNFNSEDYRKRLVELGGDSDDEEDTEKTITEAGNTTSKTRIRRRANVIDSDSDEQENGNEAEQRSQHIKNVDGKDKDDGEDRSHDNNDVVDKTSNQANADDDDGGDGDGDATWATTSATAAAAVANKKRSRSESGGSDFEDVNNEIDAAVDNDDDDDGDAFFIVRKKPTKEERTLIATEQKPTKRRRIAVIDDDEDDD